MESDCDFLMRRRREFQITGVAIAPPTHSFVYGPQKVARPIYRVSHAQPIWFSATKGYSRDEDKNDSSSSSSSADRVVWNRSR